MAKVIIEKVNTQELDVVGKTIDSATYSGDVGSRNKIKRAFITEADVEDNMTVRGEGKDTIIKKASKTEKVEVSVQLLNAEKLDDGKSLATAVLKDVWTADSKENEGMVDVYVKSGTNCQALSEILDIASNLADTATGARALGKWYPVNQDGKRLVIRIISDIDKKGKVSQDGCGCCEEDCCD